MNKNTKHQSLDYNVELRPTRNDNRPPEPKAWRSKIQILFEDEHICVINKPTGLLSVPFEGSHEKNALQMLENIMRKNGTFNSKHRPFAVHRLDRDTSGVMMFALTENAQKTIMDNWHKIVTERLYHALAENPHSKSKYLAQSGLIDDELSFNSHNVGFVPKNGEHLKTVVARTHYKIIAQGPTHTLFELSLDTGKKNQIRAHLSSKGYPIAGDKNYRAKTNHFNRLCLHARTLEFIHPFTNKKMKFEIPENPAWLKYVEQGDKPIKQAQKSNSPSMQKRLSAKDKAHMNFIEQGKLQH